MVREKKLRLALLACSLAAMGASCSFGGSDSGYPAYQPTAAPTGATPTPAITPTTAPAPSPMPTPSPSPTPPPVPVAATINETTVTSSAPDGSWSVTFKEPVVSGIDPAAAGTINAAIQSRVNSFIDDFTTAVAGSEHGSGPDTLKGSYSVAFSSVSLLSLRFGVDEYLGGASDDLRVGSLNFTLPTGTQIQLAQLFISTSAALPVLSSQTKTRLKALLGSDLAWPASPTMANFERAWAMTAAGLELSWQKYEVGPGAAGAPTITIPWASLKSVIDPAGPAAQFVP
jgi:uncharacterized protein DUF3298